MMQRATLQRIDSNQQPIGEKIEAQFNPQTLRTSYSLTGQSARSQGAPRGQQGSNTQAETQTAATNQETGFRGTLDVELLFDTTRSGANVQETTRPILMLLHAQAADPSSQAENGTTVPFVRFQCGTFVFDGRLNSFNETLDYFSSEGKPLRSTISLNLNAVSPYRIAEAGGAGGSGANAAAGLSAALSLNASAQLSASGSLSGSIGGSVGASASGSIGGSVGGSLGGSFGASAGGGAGTTPLTIAQGGESIQTVAARAGVNWRVAASINGIDNPRQIQAGAVLNLRA